MFAGITAKICIGEKTLIHAAMCDHGFGAMWIISVHFDMNWTIKFVAVSI